MREKGHKENKEKHQNELYIITTMPITIVTALAITVTITVMVTTITITPTVFSRTK